MLPIRMLRHGYQTTGSGHVLEPRDNVDQIKNGPCAITVPRAYRGFKRLERKSTTVKRLAGLWGASIRLPAESGQIAITVNPLSMERTVRSRKMRQCDDLRKHRCVLSGSRRVYLCSCPWWLIVWKRNRGCRSLRNVGFSIAVYVDRRIRLVFLSVVFTRCLTDFFCV
jgi:hypothetical protein